MSDAVFDRVTADADPLQAQPLPDPKCGGAPLRVLHLDADLVAIDKPGGLLVHPSRLDAHEPHTALDRLQTQLGQRLWTVHRLDKATSGVLLFARHAEAARVLARAFESGQIGKRYLALVRGWPPLAGDIDYPLARDPELPSAGQPRLPAVTRFTACAPSNGRWASARIRSGAMR